MRDDNVAHNGEAFIEILFRELYTPFGPRCVTIRLRSKILFKVIPWEVGLNILQLI